MDIRRYIPALLDNLIWFLLLAVVALFSFLTPTFFTPANFLNVLIHASVLGLMVVAQTFTLITGNFDLSIESTLAVTAMFGSWLIVRAGSPDNGSGWGVHPFIAIATMFLIGVSVGWLNGTLITRLKMNNFVVTLAMLIALRGVVRLVPKGNTIYGISAHPLYYWLGFESLGPIPLSVILLFVVYAVAFVILRYTRFGRELYATGANKQAALASGVNPNRRIVQVYIIAGLLAALSGWVLSGRLHSVIPNLAEGMVFEVFAAAVVGGISLQGGRGSIIGAFGGVLLLSAIDAGMNLLDVSVFWVEAIRGLIILFAMIIDAQKVRFKAAPAALVEPASAAGTAGD
jgi:ribose/xylose/arabinose/galactoside ABC-type transport system permease subunit